MFGLQAPGYFGEMALISENKERSATIRATANCECYEIYADDFYRTVGRSEAAIKIANKIEQRQREANKLMGQGDRMDQGGAQAGKKDDFVVQKRSFVVHGVCPYRMFMTEQESAPAAAKRRPAAGNAASNPGRSRASSKSRGAV